MIKKYLSYIQRQISEIRQGGCSILIRKMKAIPKHLIRHLGFIIASAFVLPIVILRPFLIIRFGMLRTERIGHFAGDTEVYLCKRDLNGESRKTFDIIGYTEPVSNRYLLNKWKELFRIVPLAFPIEAMDRSCKFWTRGDKHHIKLACNDLDYFLIEKSKPHIIFNLVEHQNGRNLLIEMGIPDGAPYVCIHNRDSAYLDKVLGSGWAYHDYRDFSVQTMSSAAEELSRRGYYVVRMGSIVEEQLISNNPMVIDYASSKFRSDFADVYLLGNCNFFLGNDSGLWCLPLIFRKPLGMVNFTLLSVFTKKNYKPWFFIVKHFYHIGRQRNLSLREIFEANLGDVSSSNKFEAAGVELVCNTPEEIQDLAIEIDERLRGVWCPQPGDDELQERFWDIFKKHVPTVYQDEILPCVGIAFLRKNLYLLD
jgi:putative glycosyltransferase (TIGR04372 family)